MSWVTTGVVMKDNVPHAYEYHSWNEKEFECALTWVSGFVKKGIGYLAYGLFLKGRELLKSDEVINKSESKFL